MPHEGSQGSDDSQSGGQRDTVSTGTMRVTRSMTAQLRSQAKVQPDSSDGVQISSSGGVQPSRRGDAPRSTITGAQRIRSDLTMSVDRIFVLDIWGLVSEGDSVFLMFKRHQHRNDGWRAAKEWTDRPAGTLTIAPGRSKYCDQAAIDSLRYMRVNGEQQTRLKDFWYCLSWYGPRCIDLSRATPYLTSSSAEAQRDIAKRFPERPRDKDSDLTFSIIKFRDTSV